MLLGCTICRFYQAGQARWTSPATAGGIMIQQ
jgi:hypothetical protein